MSYPVSYDGLCRTCLRKSEHLADIFTDEKNDVCISTVIMECAPIQISLGDGMPTQVCNDCVDKLHEAHRFREMCMQADRTLRQYLTAIATPMNTLPSVVSQDLKLEYNMPVKVELVTLPEDDPTQSMNTCVNEAVGAVKEKLLEATQNLMLLTPRETLSTVDNANKLATLKNVQLGNNFTRNADTKRFSCDVCEKTFPVNNALIKHYRTHSGERPYKCNICGKDFTCSSTLSVHIRFHNNDRRFKCNLCDKSYVVKSHLTVHMRSHTGEHPYSCHVCDKRFRISKSLTRHLKNNTCERVSIEFLEQKYNLPIGTASHKFGV